MKSGEINKNSGIYIITNILNNKKYIGFTSNFENRRNAHKSNLLSNNHPNTHLQRAYDKYGKENFIFEIFEECSEEILPEREDYWMKLFDLTNDKYGYNIRPTDINNRPKHSQETKDKISFLLKGEKSAWYGKKHSKETRLKMSLAQKGRPGLSGENHPMYGKIGGMKGKTHSLESRKKMSNALLKRDKKSIENSAEKRKKFIIQMDLNGNFIKEWKGIKIINKELKINCSCIGACCRKEQQTAGGFKWKYKDEIIS